MGKVIKTKMPVRFGNIAYVDWYLVANRSEAVIFRKARGEPLEVVDRMENPEGRKQETELTYDRAGRGRSNASHSIKQGFGKDNTHLEHVAETFARNLMKRMEKARSKERFDHLVIAAEPHFLGLLRKFISKTLEAELKAVIPKEFKYLTSDNLQERIGNWIREHRVTT